MEGKKGIFVRVLRQPNEGVVLECKVAENGVCTLGMRKVRGLDWKRREFICGYDTVGMYSKEVIVQVRPICRAASSNRKKEKQNRINKWPRWGIRLRGEKDED